jgi:stage V sporulation protein D (sporulation-specific penicillin-binding protein)
VIDCSDHRFGGFEMSEAAGHRFGRTPFMEAFARSSNVWFARAAGNLSPEEHHRALLDLGFGRGTGVEYPAEGDGILAPPQQWSGRSQPTIAIGQEVAATPLQLGLALAAVANGGTLHAPRVWLEARDTAGEVVQTNPVRPLRRVLPAGLDRTLRRALRRVVTEGTGTAADRPWLAIGGKTGTAQKAIPGRGYRDGLYTATFAGIVPVEDPRLVIVAVLDEPPGIYHYASQSAAPLFGEIVDDIRRTTTWLTDLDLASQPIVIPPPTRQVAVPDVLYLGSAHAARRLGHAGLRVAGADREGVVVDQVPAAGSLLASGETVTVTIRARDLTAQASPDLRGLSNREVQSLAARLGLQVAVEGVGFVADQDPDPGAPVPATGLRVRMAPAW